MKKALVMFFISSSMFSQINISILSFDLGYVRNYRSGGKNLYSYSPELSVGGKFFSEVLEWEVHTSYWDDGINEENKPRFYHEVFSYSNLTIGGKVYFVPSKLKFHLFLNSGISYKYISQKFVWGYHPTPLQDRYYSVLSLDLGVGFRYNLYSELRIRTELNAYIALNGDAEYYKRFSNGAVKLGFDYFLN